MAVNYKQVASILNVDGSRNNTTDKATGKTKNQNGATIVLNGNATLAIDGSLKETDGALDIGKYFKVDSTAATDTITFANRDNNTI